MRHRRRQLRHPAHEGTRTSLRILGPLMAITGLILFVYGVYDFSQGFGDHGRGIGKFWMCFLGAPLLGIGVMISKFAFLGAAARYVAGEVAPVATDTLNYVARGSKDAIREVVGAVAEGMREGGSGSASACPDCGERNDSDANFCDSCGIALATSRSCPSCGEENDADANFCNGCGAGLA